MKLVLDGAESMRKFGGAEEAKGERVRWEPRLFVPLSHKLLDHCSNRKTRRPVTLLDVRHLPFADTFDLRLN